MAAPGNPPAVSNRKGRDMRIALTALMLVLGVAGVASAAEPKPLPGESAYANLPDGVRERFVAAYRTHVAEAEESLRLNAASLKRGSRITRARVANARKYLAEVQANNPPFVPVIGGHAVGAVGRQPALRIVQVIDESTALVSTASGDIRLASGFSTAGKVDGGAMSFPGAVQVTRTTQYETVNGGTKTVFVLEPFALPWEKPKD